MQALIDVTGTGVLARCLVPADAPLSKSFSEFERSHGVYSGQIRDKKYVWLGETSRDQYSGVMFGLAIAFDMVDDAPTRERIRHQVSEHLDYLISNQFMIRMPAKRFRVHISSTFIARPEQRLNFLQIGKHVDPSRYETAYDLARLRQAATSPMAVWGESFAPRSSYFKFNLDQINLYNLIRLENNRWFAWAYRRAYSDIEDATAHHQNAFFNLIARSIHGPSAQRDKETAELLESWLRRPTRNVAVNRIGIFEVCGLVKGVPASCNPVPVAERPTTDFLWQRSPFKLEGDGDGRIEEPGIDYLLPYWMARYYRVISD